MNTIEREQLSDFLSSAIPDGRCGLYLPRFYDARVDLGEAGDLRYPGGLYADRDAKAAMRVFGLLAGTLAPDQIQLRDARELVEVSAGFPGGFVFGSRSNPVTPYLQTWFKTARAFSFDFNDDWAVVWERSDRYAIPNPSQLEPGEYQHHTDYGIVARLTSTSGIAGFVIAGLGGRATEGCSIYLADNWQRLHLKFGASDFCVLLRFPPPINPAHSEVVREKRLRD